jgi:hypothetical protein
VGNPEQLVETDKPHDFRAMPFATPPQVWEPLMAAWTPKEFLHQGVMMNKAQAIARPFPIDLKRLQQRRLLQAELIALNSDLLNFSAIRDRLAAFGKDPNVAYREILARRDRIAAKLRAMLAPTSSTTSGTPIASNAPTVPPPYRRPPLNIPGFGFSGLARLAALSEGTNVVPDDTQSSGEISTRALEAPAYTIFNGTLLAPPTASSTDDGSVRYFWLHTWQVIVTFPPPSTASYLSYQFSVDAEFSLFDSGHGKLMSFVSVGETPNLDDPFAVSTDVGWPVNADLSETSDTYDGGYGSISGQLNVQRTFAISQGKVPAVAIAVGAVVGLPVNTTANLSAAEAGGDSAISITGAYPGGIAYHVVPISGPETLG